MRVPAQNDVDACYPGRHFEVYIHAVVAQQHHRLRPFGTRLVDGFLHVAFANAKSPVWREPPGVCNRHVRKGLANDSDLYAIHLLEHIGFEDRVAKITGLDVLRNEINLAGKVAVDNFFDAFFAVGEIPMARHDVYAKQPGGVHHVLALRPQCRSAALPSVSTIKQQGARSSGLKLFDQRGQVRETAHLAVLACCPFKIQTGEGVRFGTAGLEVGGLQKVFAYQMRRLATHRTHPQVDGGLPEIAGQQLGVAIGHVQQMHIARARYVVQAMHLGRTDLALQWKASSQSGRHDT